MPSSATAWLRPISPPIGARSSKIYPFRIWLLPPSRRGGALNYAPGETADASSGRLSGKKTP
jgi:hypothetical protein